jgi:hypothetical protein
MLRKIYVRQDDWIYFWSPRSNNQPVSRRLRPMRLSGQTALAEKPPTNVSNAANTEQMSVKTNFIHMRRLVPALPITWKVLLFRASRGSVVIRAFEN